MPFFRLSVLRQRPLAAQVSDKLDTRGLEMNSQFSDTNKNASWKILFMTAMPQNPV